MTRINCVPVAELHPKHLVAEYRELPRVYALAQAHHDRMGSWTAVPSEYTLGAGHVKFFYTRMAYVRERHGQLIAEMFRRGYNPTLITVPGMRQLPKPYHQYWIPTPEALAINRSRINDRMPK
jgi:deoxyribonuclease (pyrimidine dimer)